MSYWLLKINGDDVYTTEKEIAMNMQRTKESIPKIRKVHFGESKPKILTYRKTSKFIVKWDIKVYTIKC